jgi:hypothetical protein
MLKLRSLFKRRRPPLLQQEQQPPLTYQSVVDNLRSAVRDLESMGLDPRTVHNLLLTSLEQEAFTRDDFDATDRADFLDFARQSLDLALATEG